MYLRISIVILAYLLLLGITIFFAVDLPKITMAATIVIEPVVTMIPATYVVDKLILPRYKDLS